MGRKKALRELYAEIVTAGSRPLRDGGRLVRAFSSVRREDFLGPGPWRIFTPGGYLTTPSRHPESLYQDVLVALDAGKGLNNGQPSLHAAALAALDVRPGETVVHVGAGGGYYTAILAELTGTLGRVVAYELDASLARRARANLADRANVVVHAVSGVDASLPPADAVYVNAGATHPAPAWLDALGPGGRLLFPLTSSADTGGLLLSRRIDASRHAARFLCPVGFVPCAGARDAASGRRLAEAFAGGDAGRVRSLHTDGAPDDSCWVAGEGWWLSTRAVDEGTDG